MAQSVSFYPGGVLASPFHLVSAMASSGGPTPITRVPEGLLIDGKAERYTSGEAFLKDVCSFANGAGGVIVLGMKENKSEGRWTPCGVEAVSEMRVQLRDWLMGLEPPGVPDLNMEQVSHGGRDFLVVQVPRASHRPVCFQKSDGQCQFWVREHDRNRPLSLREVFDSFATRYRRYDRRSLILNSMRKRFEEAAIDVRSVRVTMVVGSHSESDIQSTIEQRRQDRNWSANGTSLSGPLLIAYDQDIEKSFGVVPDVWVCCDSDGKPKAIRLPGSESLAIFDAPSSSAAHEFKQLMHDAGLVFGDLLRAHQAFRRTFSDISQVTTDPMHAWLLHLAIEAARLPDDDPLRCRVRSWLFGIDFDYASVFGQDWHAPLAHVVSQEQVKEAALRRLRFEFQGDLCLLSAVSLLGLSHTMFEA